MVNRIKHLIADSVYLLLAYMPLHILLAQSLSLLTGGLSIWKIGKDILLFVLVITSLVILWLKKKTTKLLNSLLLLVFAYGLIHLITWTLNSDNDTTSSLLGAVYNNRVVWFLILGLSAALMTKTRFEQSKLIKFILTISTAVAILGILQYFLPKDILTHLGYSVERGVKPNFFIDDKPDLPRIMSTLRDPNSLGAYLLIPLGLLLVQLREYRKRILTFGLLLLHFLALLLTFSRAAWGGAVIMTVAISFMTMKATIYKYRRIITASLIAIILVVGSLGFLLRDQYVVQNIVLHSDKSTVATEDSNELHLRFVRDGLRDIVRNPLGHGPGTAGIVSIRNTGEVKLTENYYVQIGYEVGILGLMVFVVICWTVIRGLWWQKDSLSSVLLASFLAYSVMALIMHIWSNEAVTAQWWLLAGVLLAQTKNTTRRGDKHRV